MRKNKKGDVSDFGVLITIVFVLGITFFIGGILWFNVVNPIKDKMINESDNLQTKQDIEDAVNGVGKAMNMLDWVFVMFFFGFYLVLLISVFYLDTYPGFLIFALLGLIIMFIISAFVADSWANLEAGMSSELVANGKISPASSYPMMNYILTNLPVFIIVMSSLFLIVLYASKRNG